MPTDIITTYDLYIDQENYEIDFIAYDFKPANGVLFMREAFNRRKIEGITFNDYRTFRTATDSVSLGDLPHLLGENKLELQSPFTPKDITVKLTD